MSGFFERNRRFFSLIPQAEDDLGFRNCQLGAVWAAKSHFTVSNSHALINMPTGSGKTALMIALAFEFSARRVFIITPMKLIREQTAEKFASLALLRKIGVLDETLQEQPQVKQVTTMRCSEDDWNELLEYDVVVATPQTVFPGNSEERRKERQVTSPPPAFFGCDGGEQAPFFDLVFVDEAHHSAARTWNRGLKLMQQTKVILLTATPFRQDRKRIRAKPIYIYPISRAVKDGIYREVRFEPVQDLDREMRDNRLAERALTVLNQELKKNPDARVIIKAKSIRDADNLEKIYIKAGWDSIDSDRRDKENDEAIEDQESGKRIGVIHSGRSDEENDKVIEGVKSGELRGFITVHMGGEGLDIPNLKIAVLHEAPRTLPYTVQLIGRVSRVHEGQDGDAVLIADPTITQGSEVQELYKSQRGWSQILPDLFDAYVKKSRYLPSDRDMIEDLPGLLKDDLRPYFTVRVYTKVKDEAGFKDSVHDIEVENEDIVVVLCNRDENTVFIVTRTVELPTWTSHRWFETDRYDLHIFHIEQSLLFEYTTSELVCRGIREKVISKDSYVRAGYYLIRNALRDATRSHYYMLGLANRSGVIRGNPQYKTYLGSDVEASLRISDSRVFGAGHAMMKKDDGETRGIAINSSKVWSNRRDTLTGFQTWCSRITPLILHQGTSSIPHIEDKLMETRQISKFDAQPISVLFDSILFRSSSTEMEVNGKLYKEPICFFSNPVLNSNSNGLDCNLLVHDCNGALEATIPVSHALERSPFWKSDPAFKVLLKFDLGSNDYYLEHLGGFFEDFPPTIVLQTGETVERNLLHSPGIQTPRLENSLIEVKSWDETDLRKEAKPPGKGYAYNVQQRTEEIILGEFSLSDDDFLICDDRANEVADYILIQKEKNQITFFHCKYKKSNGADPGISEEDVSDLVSQGIRTGNWICANNLVERLILRVKGNSRFVRGGLKSLEDLADRFFPTEWQYTVVLVQPGISKKKLIERKRPSAAEQLLITLYDRVVDYNAQLKLWVSS